MSLESKELPMTPPKIVEFLNRVPIVGLTFGAGDSELGREIRSLPIEALFAPHKIIDAESARLVQAGLLTMVDQFDAAHAIAQEIETPSGSYWHGIQHRREPDPFNAKYWFRRVGRHPIYDVLAQEAKRLVAEDAAFASWPEAEWLSAGKTWSSERFVDLCAAAAADPQRDELYRRIQRRECELLVDYCARAAVGSA
ncbi:MAG: hypothetical protein QM811_05805 [Pirellulales bacterium]